MNTDSKDARIVCAIIDMGHSLGQKIVAEGVETEQQRDLLINANCDYAQGYFFSRPIPPEEFEVWMKDRNRRLYFDLAGTPVGAYPAVHDVSIISD